MGKVPAGSTQAKVTFSKGLQLIGFYGNGLTRISGIGMIAYWASACDPLINGTQTVPAVNTTNTTVVVIPPTTPIIPITPNITDSGTSKMPEAEIEVAPDIKVKASGLSSSLVIGIAIPVAVAILILVPLVSYLILKSKRDNKLVTEGV
jgi:hypothetical protein